VPRPYYYYGCDEEDPVKVIGHDHEYIQLDTSEVDRDLLPAYGDSLSCR